MILSIIIALYNTEDFIENCIRSIYERNPLSENSFEVIIINDGSTDKSKMIVESMMLDYSNIILINKLNGGQSSARNIGFNKAKGDYIFCLDSDDSIEASEFIQALFYGKENNLDVIPIYYEIYDSDFNLVKDKIDNYPIIDVPMTGGEFMSNYVISGSMWRYFYKSSLIKENKLSLTEGIFHEDEEFIIKFLCHTQRITYQRHLVYRHLIREGSTINRKDKSHRIRLLRNLLTVINNLIEYRLNFNNKTKTYYGVSKKIEQLVISVFLRMKKDGLTYIEIEEFITKLKYLDLYPIKISKLNFKFKIVSKLFNNTYFNKVFFR